MITHNLGFPRIGKNRELKKSLEQFWQKKISKIDLLDQAKQLRQENWNIQRQNGIDLLPVGDFALYDQMLSTSVMLGIVPHRFHDNKSSVETEFAIARGQSGSGCNCAASDMTKWFDTNYHYIVPEITEQTEVCVDTSALIAQVQEAKRTGHKFKPIIIGPVTYLYLSTSTLESKLAFLPTLLKAYQIILDDLDEQGCEWIQIDEPILSLELDESWQQAVIDAYKYFKKGGSKWLLATYFGRIDHLTNIVSDLNIDGIHIDTTAEQGDLASLVYRLPKHWVISLGVIDGRNIWKTDLVSTYQTILPLYNVLGDRLWLAPSCSLLHSPIDLNLETKLDADVKSWLAFAVQKCHELRLLSYALTTKNTDQITQYSSPVLKRLVSDKCNNQQVKAKVSSLVPNDYQRVSRFEARHKVQQEALKLPLYPTTTIGSFPQTSDIRITRAKWKRKELSDIDYQEAIKAEISSVIRKQESIGLDVLVHGEAERNDMVEYFGEQLNGCAITEFAWVQSYGSRCVKPPIIYGDVSRPKPMTVPWISYANSLTDKPVKAMLTGPITIMSWSFIRNNISREEVAKQIALAIKDEVSDLVQQGIGIIQIDEPAIKEAMPLKRSQWQDYSRWATQAFRLCSAHVDNDIQIHSHICYSEFNDIISSLIELDADVLTIETSRSNMEILEAFENVTYPNALGPGVYDIHSPNVPSVEWIKGLIAKAGNYLPTERIWVNPDCGLKTRAWEETEAALKNLVVAAKSLREVC
jgi:5-methyltetrahydropteroyltriglutamate--homocysteine methyltransferase